MRAAQIDRAGRSSDRETNETIREQNPGGAPAHGTAFRDPQAQRANQSVSGGAVASAIADLPGRGTCRGVLGAVPPGARCGKCVRVQSEASRKPAAPGQSPDKLAPKRHQVPDVADTGPGVVNQNVQSAPRTGKNGVRYCVGGIQK